MVTAEGNEITDLERLEVDVLRWQALEVDISELNDRSAAIRAVGQALERALDDTPSHLPLAVRVTFTGRSAVHADLLADELQLRQEVVAQSLAVGSDRLWIEKVRIASEAASTEPLPADEAAQGALADLTGLTALAGDDPDFIESLKADWMAVLDKLPYDVVQASIELQSLRKDPLAEQPERVRQAIPMLLGRVAQSARSSR